VIPAAFEYVRADSIGQAADLLGTDEDAKLLAGGHSLVPLMKLRLAAPTLLVDIGRISQLRYIRDEGDSLAIGALTRHRELETSDIIRSRAGLLRAVAGQIGDPQVRHRGTIGGSVAHGDPASDLPAALMALAASYVLTGPEGTRIVTADDFHLGYLHTALDPAEILTEVRVPAGLRRFAFRKFRGRSIDWAVAGVAVAEGAAGVRVALINMGATPLRAHQVEAALAAGQPAAQAAQHAAAETTPLSDLNAGADFRRHLARVLVGQALDELTTPARRQGELSSG
jgi:aerobic carbon-monoxide dehydrogenase medium subunit